MATEPRLFLDASQVLHDTLAYRQLAERAFQIGDPRLRRTTQLDLVGIEQLRTDDRIAPEQRLEYLSDLLTPSTVTTLAKIHAVLASVDVMYEAGQVPPSFIHGVSEAILSAPDPGDAEVLTGAMFARDVYHRTTEGDNWLDIFNTRFATHFGKPDNEQQERFALGVEIAAKTVAHLAEIGRLGMQLPNRLITVGESDTKSYEPLGGKFPDKTMVLGEGRLPSWLKMMEAAQLGMPKAPFVLERRMPRLLVGAEVEVTPQEMGSGGELISAKNRRFVGLECRPLIRPDCLAIEEFPDPRVYTQNEILENATFDSLSVFTAIRAAREARPEFTRIDFDSREPAPFSQKRQLLDREVGKVVNRLVQPYWLDEQGLPVSMLGIAVGESQRIDGYEGWDEPEAALHLARTAPALVFKREKDGKVAPRSDSEIMQLYKDWASTQLEDNDWVEMGLILLQDIQNSVWDGIQSQHIQDVSLATQGIAELSPEAKKNVAAAVVQAWPEIAITHMETIRDRVRPIPELRPGL